eukprot:COSAG01_NODE_58316_length_306_cov_6.309179_1_plen_34_part_10
MTNLLMTYRAAAWQAAQQHVFDRCSGGTRRRRLV